MIKNHHTLKLWPEYFQAKLDGKKPWEYRTAIDRRFAVGDVVNFLEWDPDREKYTGRNIGPVKIIYVLRVDSCHDVWTHEPHDAEESNASDHRADAQGESK
jgi:hypothetical protein